MPLGNRYYDAVGVMQYLDAVIRSDQKDGMGECTMYPLRVITDDDRVLDNPSDVDLYNLLADMNFGHPFLIVERPDLLPLGQHYIQVHMDLDIDPSAGRGYFVEYRDGGPDRHFGATARDDAPWDSVHSPAFERVAKVVQDWAFQRDGWREAMSWERIDLGA